jgi:hypothetical protein
MLMGGIWQPDTYIHSIFDNYHLAVKLGPTRSKFNFANISKHLKHLPFSVNALSSHVGILGQFPPKNK